SVSSPLMFPRAPRSTPFPYTTLFRSRSQPRERVGINGNNGILYGAITTGTPGGSCVITLGYRWRYPCPSVSDSPDIVGRGITGEDRKSTRLNSSHVKISYAVFCLKKK